jgi:hypothetical protein
MGRHRPTPRRLVADGRERINRVVRTTSFATLLDRMRAGQLAP